MTIRRQLVGFTLPLEVFSNLSRKGERAGEVALGRGMNPPLPVEGVALVSHMKIFFYPRGLEGPVTFDRAHQPGAGVSAACRVLFLGM